MKLVLNIDLFSDLKLLIQLWKKLVYSADLPAYAFVAKSFSSQNDIAKRFEMHHPGVCICTKHT